MSNTNIYLIYIGEKFYSRSHTAMSSLYKVENGGTKFTRYDWGFVQMALDHGDAVHINPATPTQMLWAYEELLKYMEEPNEA